MNSTFIVLLGFKMQQQENNWLILYVFIYFSIDFLKFL